MVLGEVKKTFNPEFINRVDEIIVFEPLTEKELEQIVDLMLAEVRKRLSDRQVDFEVTERARQELVREGFDRQYGARPLRRTVQRRIENALARQILAGEFKEGDVAHVDFADGEFRFSTAAGATPEPQPVGATAP
jgi:ATP-dependent Clp protease ATP-binding subunit ClpC